MDESKEHYNPVEDIWDGMEKSKVKKVRRMKMNLARREDI
jgi:hypothetical protein